MISPINFRASVGSIAVDTPVKAENTKTETVTAPIETAASFKGAEALASYNKAILAADSAEEDTEAKAPAFKGEEIGEEPEKAPAFKGEDTVEEAPKEETEEVSEEKVEEKPAE